MAFTYRYYEGKDGRHYCYAKDPTFVCPLAEPTEYVVPAGEASETEGEHRIKLGHLGLLTAAAGVLGVGALELGMMLKRTHNSGRAGRKRVDGKLTDTCGACGHKLDRLGFRGWVEREPTAEEADNASDRIGSRLFGAGPRWRNDETHYFDTKKEVMEWAREEAKLERVGS